MRHTIVMTGASRGIGRVAAEHILRQSPDVHLLVVARGSSGARLAAELSAGGHAVSHVPADLGSLDSVRSAAAEIRDRLERGDLPPLRGFVGNAGIQYTNALTEGPDGFESTFAINVLANHLFVRLLQDRFVAPARIVITASDTHFGDFKHNMGMVPGPAWKSPDVLARTGAFPKPDTAVGGRTAGPVTGEDYNRLWNIPLTDTDAATDLLQDHPLIGLNGITLTGSSILLSDFNGGRLLSLRNNKIREVAAGLTNPGQLATTATGDTYLAGFGAGAIHRLLP